MSDYFVYPPLTANTVARAADVNARFMGVSAGFDKLPPPDYIKDDRVTFAPDEGTTNALIIHPALPITAYTLGLHIRVQAANGNTGVATINVSDLGVKQIIRSDGSPLEQGDITVGQMLDLVYDGNAFQLAMAFAELSPAGLGEMIEAIGDVDFSGDLNVAGDVFVTDEPYGPGWDSDVSVPTKNSVYDKIQTLAASMGGGISDVPYGPAWDGQAVTSPSQNAVYDKFATVDAAIALNANGIAANTNAINGKVAKAGDTMTGSLAITTANPVLYLTGTAGSNMTAISFNRAGGGGSSIQGWDNLLYHTDGNHTFFTDAVARMQVNDVGMAVTGNVDVTGIVHAASLYSERPDGGAVYLGTGADNVYLYWNKTSLIIRAPSWLFVRSSDNGTMASIDGSGNFYGAGAVLAGNISMTNAAVASILMGAGPMARVTATPGQLTLRSNAHVWQRESDGVQLASLGSAGDLVLAGSTYARGDFIQGDTPTSWWQNANYRSFGIHVNSGYAYFMRGAVNGTTWTPLANGAWPMQLNLEDGGLVCGGYVQSKGNIYAQTDRRCYQQGSPGIGGGAEIFMATAAPSGGNDGDIWLQYI
jgi:hypothetical protein